MLFHKQNNIINKLNLRINNNIINETDKFNSLGLHINSRLTWDSHIKEVSTKIKTHHRHHKEVTINIS